MNKVLNRIIEDKSALFLIGALVVSSFAFNANAADASDIESVTIIGSKDDVKDLAGSGAVISNEDLEKAMEDKNDPNYKKYLEIREKNLHKMSPIPVCKFNE